MNHHLLRLRLKILSLIEYGKSPAGAFAIALIGIVLAVYATWFNDKKPSLAYAIALEATLVSRHAAGEGVTVSVGGQSVDVETTPLVALYVRLWNSGDTTFRPPDFDQKAPLGIRISGGKVLRASIDSATADYLKANLAASLSADGAVTVPAAILEPQDAFVIKALVLKTQKSGSLQVKPLGKIAGVPNFDEFYAHTAGDPELIIDYRSKTTTKYVLITVAALTILNFGISVSRWIRRRFGKQGRQKAGPP
jgi:hypothetical protein